MSAVEPSPADGTVTLSARDVATLRTYLRRADPDVEPDADERHAARLFVVGYLGVALGVRADGRTAAS